MEQEYAYLFMDGVWHKRRWGGSVENAGILVAIGIGADGRREVLSVAEGMKEDAESWRSFIKGMLARGLKGVTDDRRPVRRARGGRRRAAARRALSAVHGAFRAQHPRQGQPQEPRLGRRRLEGRVLHGDQGQGAGEGGVRRRGDGGEEAEGGGVLASGTASARRRPTCSTTIPASIGGASGPTT